MSITRQQAALVQNSINNMMWVYSDAFCGIDLDDDYISFIFGSTMHEYELDNFESCKQCLCFIHNTLWDLSAIEDLRRFTP